MEGGPKRNISSDKLGTTPVYILIIKVTFQEAPMIGTCIINVPGWWESCYHRIKCTTTTLLAVFMWRRPLNSTALVITTHRKPKRVSDGTGTQIKAQMINKCRIKMVQRELYNVRDLPWGRERKNRERIL